MTDNSETIYHTDAVRYGTVPQHVRPSWQSDDDQMWGFNWRCDCVVCGHERRQRIEALVCITAVGFLMLVVPAVTLWVRG